MSNKRYNKQTTPGNSGVGGGSNKAQGSGVPTSMPEKTANWPGLPGKGGPNRAGGAPTTGHTGPFRVKSTGI